MTTSNTAVTTIRAHAEELALIASHGFAFRPSNLKDNWAMFAVFGDEDDMWRRKGAHVDHMGNIHVSLTGLAASELVKAGLVDPLSKAMGYLRPSVMTKVKVMEVLPGLWVLSTGDMCDHHTFVAASLNPLSAGKSFQT